LHRVGSPTFSMADTLRAFPWVVGPIDYADCTALIERLPDIVKLAHERAATLRTVAGSSDVPL